MTNPNVNATNHSIANTTANQSASGNPICHEWVWFRLEGQSGCSLGPVQMECQSIVLIIHQKLGVMCLPVQQLNHHYVLIEFESEVDVEWVAQKLLRMVWWMGVPCNFQCESGCSLGPAQMECQSIALIIHQELRVMTLSVQWWMGAPCHLECVPCSSEEGLQQFGEGNG